MYLHALAKRRSSHARKQGRFISFVISTRLKLKCQQIFEIKNQRFFVIETKFGVEYVYSKYFDLFFNGTFPEKKESSVLIKHAVDVAKFETF